MQIHVSPNELLLSLNESQISSICRAVYCRSVRQGVGLAVYCPSVSQGVGLAVYCRSVRQGVGLAVYCPSVSQGVGLAVYCRSVRLGVGLPVYCRVYPTRLMRRSYRPTYPLSPCMIVAYCIPKWWNELTNLRLPSISLTIQKSTDPSKRVRTAAPYRQKNGWFVSIRKNVSPWNLESWERLPNT